MSEPITISAKDLGAVALPGFCPRCFWLEMRSDGLPYQIFPGIFSSIDTYGKKLVHGWFDRHGEAPRWLAPLGDIRSYIDPPHYSKFGIHDPETNVTLRGTPDGILVMRDGSHVIVDYKTAKFTMNQDSLFPMYEVQLNSYAVIGAQNNIAPVSALVLIYTEPVTSMTAACNDSYQDDTGFLMNFTAHFRPVDLNPGLIPPLLARVRSICDLPKAPESIFGCKNCALLKVLIDLAE